MNHDGRTAARTGERVRALYEVEARRALLLSVGLRFGVIAAFLGLAYAGDQEPAIRWMDIATTLVFAPVGLLQLVMVWRRVTWGWPKYALILIDVVLLTTVAMLPWPGDLTAVHPALALREVVVAYSFLLLLFAVLYFSPWAIVWFAACSFVAWIVAFGSVVVEPGVVTAIDMPAGLGAEDALAFSLGPDFVDLEHLAEELILLVIVALAMAVVVARMRHLALTAARSERRRGNLARYFSPTVLDDLEQRDLALRAGRETKVAVLFADLKDFTTITERLPPAEVLALLRDVHGAMEEQVFAYGGSLEKYIGDALMASFGSPTPREHDASHALCCAWAMFSALDGVNARRAAAGQAPIAMGVGLHYGDAVTGDIGSERNMAFTTVGATVNLASRVQGLSRDLGCDLVVTADLEARLRRETPAAAHVLLAAYAAPVTVTVKGFADAVTVRSARRPAAPGNN